jgi:hypothetical protein
MAVFGLAARTLEVFVELVGGSVQRGIDHAGVGALPAARRFRLQLLSPPTIAPWETGKQDGAAMSASWQASRQAGPLRGVSLIVGGEK